MTMTKLSLEACQLLLSQGSEVKVGRISPFAEASTSLDLLAVAGGGMAASRLVHHITAKLSAQQRLLLLLE
jgi:hypothetical protein